MPLYEYECGQCGQRSVRLQKADQDTAGINCPHCGSRELKRLFSSFSLGRGSAMPESPAGTPSRKAPPPTGGPEFHRLMVTNNPELLK